MDRIWKSRSVVEPATKKQPQLLLPSQISNKIIQLEMEIDDGEVSKQVIVQLLHEYTKAIEFFQERSDDRYKLYQKKMQKFLQKPVVDVILKGGKSNMLMKKERTEEQVRKASTQNKVVAKKILECSEQGFQKQKTQIEKQIAQQNQKLEERIQRKRTHSTKNVKGKYSASFSTSTAKDEEPLILDFQEIKQVKAAKKVYL